MLTTQILTGILLFSPLGTNAEASDYINSIGNEFELDGVGGGWGRAFGAGDGEWYYLFGGSGDYRMLVLDADYNFTFASALYLTGRIDLVDHAIERCPDGTYLHVASGAVTVHDDSAYGFRYDENWDLIVENDIDVDNPDYRHNDLPVLCSTAVDLAVFQPNLEEEAPVFILDDDLNRVDSNLTMSPVPPVPGSSLIYDEDTNTIIRVTAPHIDEESDEDRNKLIIYRIYWDLEEPYEVMTEIDLSGAGLGTDSQAYWPQGFVEIGDFYFVAHMARGLNDGFQQDLGNIYLEIFDRSFNRVDTEQLTFDPAPEGNQRPSISLQEDILLVTYDKRVSNTLHNYLMEIELNTELLNAGVPNLAPTAYAGADIPGSIGGLVTLDGSGSSDPDGDELSFEWVFAEVPESSGLTDDDIVNAYTDAPTFVPDVAGDFEIELTVSDAETSDSDSVVVAAVDNLPPVADAGGGGGVSLGESVLLDGSLSSDPEGESLVYSWTFSELPEDSSLTDADIAANNTMLAAFEPDVDGVYVVTLAVSDGVFTSEDSAEFSTSGCGCTSSPTTSNTAPWALLLFGMGLLRRRE